MTDSNNDLDVQLARLTLLALRATFAPDASLRRDRYRTSAKPDPVTEDQLIPELVNASKPLLCSARILDDMLQVAWRPLEEDPMRFRSHERARAKQEQAFKFLLDRDQVSPDAVLILCCGGRETLLLPLHAVRRWETQYMLEYFNFGRDDVANPRASDQPEYREARAKGALGILAISPPAKFVMRIDGDLDATPGTDPFGS